MPPGNPGLPTPMMVAPCRNISWCAWLWSVVTGASSEALHSMHIISPVIRFRAMKSRRVRAPLGVWTVIWGAYSRSCSFSFSSEPRSNSALAALLTLSCALRRAASCSAGDSSLSASGSATSGALNARGRSRHVLAAPRIPPAARAHGSAAVPFVSCPAVSEESAGRSP